MLAPGTTAHCERCGTALRKARRHPLEHSLALTVAALILLAVMCTTTLMTVSTSGIVHGAGIFSGPLELQQRGMTSLAVVVVFVTVAAPLAKLIGTIYVLLRIRESEASAASSAHFRLGRASHCLVDGRGLCVGRLRCLRKAR